MKPAGKQSHPDHFGRSPPYAQCWKWTKSVSTSSHSARTDGTYHSSESRGFSIVHEIPRFVRSIAAFAITS